MDESKRLDIILFGLCCYGTGMFTEQGYYGLAVGMGLIAIVAGCIIYYYD